MTSLHLSPTKYFLSFPHYKRKFLSNWKYFYIACWNTFYEEKSNKMKIYSNIYSKSDKKIYRKYCCRNQPKNRKNRNCFHQLITNFIDWHNSWNVSKAHDNWTRTNDVWFVIRWDCDWFYFCWKHTSFRLLVCIEGEYVQRYISMRIVSTWKPNELIHFSWNTY